MGGLCDDRLKTSRPQVEGLAALPPLRQLYTHVVLLPYVCMDTGHRGCRGTYPHAPVAVQLETGGASGRDRGHAGNEVSTHQVQQTNLPHVHTDFYFESKIPILDQSKIMRTKHMKRIFCLYQTFQENMQYISLNEGCCKSHGLLPQLTESVFRKAQTLEKPAWTK